MVNLVNCYEPYVDRQQFWNLEDVVTILEITNLIWGGDLNFTLLGHDIYGGRVCLDPLSPFFENKFEVAQMVDIEPVPLNLTWRNSRQGEDGIAKCLDRFLVSEYLLGLFDSYRSWVLVESLSNHQQVLLQLAVNKELIPIPFKFSRKWLEDEEFRNLIKNIWRSIRMGSLPPIE